MARCYKLANPDSLVNWITKPARLETLASLVAELKEHNYYHARKIRCSVGETTPLPTTSELSAIRAKLDAATAKMAKDAKVAANYDQYKKGDVIKIARLEELLGRMIGLYLGLVFKVDRFYG